MFGAFLASVLAFQAAQHRNQTCCCGQVVVTSWVGVVEGVDDAWGGMRPRVRFTPDQVEYRRCPWARRRGG